MGKRTDRIPNYPDTRVMFRASMLGVTSHIVTPIKGNLDRIKVCTEIDGDVFVMTENISDNEHQWFDTKEAANNHYLQM